MASLASLAFGSSCCIKVGAPIIMENKRYNVSNIVKLTGSKFFKEYQNHVHKMDEMNGI
jgi:hypothetical protein